MIKAPVARAWVRGGDIVDTCLRRHSWQIWDAGRMEFAPGRSCMIYHELV